MTERDMERARAAKAAYMRDWSRKNRKKRQEANLRYWLRKANEAEREATEQGNREEVTQDEHASD